jgi:hypothetical protein
MELLFFPAMMVLTHNLNNPPLVVVVLLPNTFNFALIINLMVLLLLSFAQWCLILPTFKSPGLFNMPKLIILNALLLPSVFEAPWTIPDLVLPPLWMLNLSFLTFVAL